MVYQNYYFQYMMYFGNFYNLDYQNINQFFQSSRNFTLRNTNNHILLTGFDDVNLKNNEYIVTDTVKSGSSLYIYNLKYI